MSIDAWLMDVVVQSNTTAAVNQMVAEKVIKVRTVEAVSAG